MQDPPTSTPRRPATAALAVLAVTVGVMAIAISLVLTTPAPAAAPAGAQASPAPAVGSDVGWTSPNGQTRIRPGYGFGRGGFGGGMQHGWISITAIDGTKLALKTDDGWTRTIDAAGATITKDGATASVSDLKVGDRIVFRETRGSDGTYTITAISVIQPVVAGTVSSVSGSTVEVKGVDGSTTKVLLTDSTKYQLGGASATKDVVVAGARIAARGSLGTDGSLTASSVEIAPATAAGTVKEKGGSSLTLTTRDGSTTVVKVTDSTTFHVNGIDKPTLADVKVGDVVIASGAHNADGSLTATVVRASAAGGWGGPWMGGPGGGFGGGMRGDGGWGFPGGPGWPAPSATPSGTGTSG
jgi:hypothetical protein